MLSRTNLKVVTCLTHDDDFVKPISSAIEVMTLLRYKRIIIFEYMQEKSQTLFKSVFETFIQVV